jgi:hypothetical protein
MPGYFISTDNLTSETAGRGAGRRAGDQTAVGFARGLWRPCRGVVQLRFGEDAVAARKSPARAGLLRPEKIRAWVVQARESSDSPMLNAFCRVAPSVRFRVRAIFPAGVFFRASDFKSRTCAVVQARLFDPFLGMHDLRILRTSRLYL